MQGRLLFFYRKERRRNREQILTPDEIPADLLSRVSVWIRRSTE